MGGRSVAAVLMAIAVGACSREPAPPTRVAEPDLPGAGALSIEASHIADVAGEAIVVRVELKNRLPRPSTVKFERVGDVAGGWRARFKGFTRCARECVGGVAATDAERTAHLDAIDTTAGVDLAPDMATFLVFEIEATSATTESCRTGVRSLVITDNGNERHLTGPEKFVVASPRAEAPFCT